MGYTDTNKYKFKKPDASNKFDISDLNNNLDAIDRELNQVDSTGRAYTDSNAKTINGRISKIETSINKEIEEIKKNHLNLNEKVELLAPIVSIDNESIPKTITVEINNKSSTAAFDAQGEIVFSKALPYATYKMVRDEDGKVMSEGPLTATNFLTGPGRFTLTVTQFGQSYTRNLIMSDKLTINPDEFTRNVKRSENATLWRINGTTVNESSIMILSSKTYSIYEEFGRWMDKLIYGNGTLESTQTYPKIPYTNAIWIVTDTSTVYPLTATYECVACGGGGGGASGSAGMKQWSGGGGSGGFGGKVEAFSFTKTKGDPCSILIGQGGAGGRGVTGNDSSTVYGLPGENGSPTIIDGKVINGGTGAPETTHTYTTGGWGGAGANGEYIKIFKTNYMYGGPGHGGKPNKPGEPGKDSEVPIDQYSWMGTIIGRGGDGGMGGVSYESGGERDTIFSDGGRGGYAIDDYGHGGAGGDGGYDETPYASDDGISGTHGVVKIRIVNL